MVIENVNRTHIINSNKLIKRQKNNLDLYSIDSKGIIIKGDRSYIPIRTIDEIYILKKCIIDTETLSFLADNNIVAHIFSRNQRFTGCFFPSSKQSVNKSGFVFISQLRAFDDKKHRLYLAKQITKGHLSGLQKNLHNYKIKNYLLEKYESIDKCKTIQELMGIEGIAKKEYYSKWNDIIKNQKQFKFTKRTKRPPADKINVLISYLNSRIYSICLCEIYKTELDPRISFLHEPNFKSVSLHLDIAEIFKPLIADKIIFYLLNNNIIKADDFVKDNGIYILSKKAIQNIELEIIRKLSSTMIINGMVLNYRFIILKEVNKIKKSITEFGEYMSFSEERV